MTKIIYIEGMTCQHCVRRVEKTLNEIEGVVAKVSLETSSAKITLAKDIDDTALKSAIEDAGYIVTSIVN